MSSEHIYFGSIRLPTPQSFKLKTCCSGINDIRAEHRFRSTLGIALGNLEFYL